MPASINLSNLASRAYAVQSRDLLARNAEHAASARRPAGRPAIAGRADEDAVRVELSPAARRAVAGKSGATIQHRPSLPRTYTEPAPQAGATATQEPVRANGAGRREAPRAAVSHSRPRFVPPGSHIDIRI